MADSELFGATTFSVLVPFFGSRYLQSLAVARRCTCILTCHSATCEYASTCEYRFWQVSCHMLLCIAPASVACCPGRSGPLLALPLGPFPPGPFPLTAHFDSAQPCHAIPFHSHGRCDTLPNVLHCAGVAQRRASAVYA